MDFHSRSLIFTAYVTGALVVYTVLNGWAVTKCLISLSRYLAPTPLFSGRSNVPKPWALNTYSSFTSHLSYDCPNCEPEGSRNHAVLSSLQAVLLNVVKAASEQEPRRTEQCMCFMMLWQQ